MGENDKRLERIEEHIIRISTDIGSIKQFMETSTTQTEALFKRVNKLEIHGCANMPDHVELNKVVTEHEKVLNKAVGAMIATGAIGSFLGTIGGWALSLLHK